MISVYFFAAQAAQKLLALLLDKLRRLLRATFYSKLCINYWSGVGGSEQAGVSNEAEVTRSKRTREEFESDDEDDTSTVKRAKVCQ